jgi:hypothetical protein
MVLFMVHELGFATSKTMGDCMAELWKIGQDKWINPAHIVMVTDSPPGPAAEGVVVVDTTYVRSYVQLRGEERETLLAYLARETVAPPPPTAP